MNEFERVINSAIRKIPPDDPMDFIHDLYKTVSPPFIRMCVDDARQVLQHENRKNGKAANCHFVLGSDGNTRSMFNGVIGALLWLQVYLDQMKEQGQVSDEDMATTKKVLSSCMLPSCVDEEKQAADEKRNCRDYASFLGSFVNWVIRSGDSSSSTPGSDGDGVGEDGDSKTNLELVRYLTASALGNFPALPFTAFFIGPVKTNDLMQLNQRMTTLIKWENYMSKQSVQLNQPRFIISMDDSPLIGNGGHPFANTLIGQEPNPEWFSLYIDSKEFERVVVGGDVRKYFAENTLSQHHWNLQQKCPLAMMIEGSKMLRVLFQEFQDHVRSK
jgi:hypothetical protein